jgi:hypothetical protein
MAARGVNEIRKALRSAMTRGFLLSGGSMLSSFRRTALLAATLLGLSAAVTPVLATQPALTSSTPRPVRASKRSLFGGIRASGGMHGRKGAGISMAQQQRGAAKKRNVTRNRRNHR